jgi:hypothetical protein
MLDVHFLKLKTALNVLANTYGAQLYRRLECERMMRAGDWHEGIIEKIWLMRGITSSNNRLRLCSGN